MGEQSAKQLRGARMDEVIFAGNAQRRPLGMAEITLSFDNSDGTLSSPFAEVAVTRRVYRTGESEYFINRSQARLRDVVDLLLGTGLGPDAAAIISQGQIDAVLSAKPHERRQIFEEAAGTSRYQARKHEAQRRLEQTDSNALRINDILAEIEAQIPALEQAVRRTRRHQRVSRKLRDLEILAFVRKTEARQRERARLRSASAVEEDRRAHADARRARCEAQASQARVQEYQTTLAVDESNGMRAQAAAVVAAIASDQASAEARAAEAERRCRALEAEVASAARDAARSQERLAALVHELETGRRMRDDALSEAAGAAQIEADANAHWEKAYAALRDSEDRRAQAAAQLAQIDATVQGQAAECKRLTQALAGIWQELADARRRADQAREQMRAHIADLRSLEDASASDSAEAAEALERQQQAAAALEAAREAAAKAAAACTDVDARLDALAEIEHAGIGAPAGARAIREQLGSQELAGIIGSIADLISVDETYAFAIDAALGTHVHDIVTRSAADAQRAIRFLKAQRAGRATFLPLDLATSGGLRADAPELAGLTQAIGLVRCADEVRPVVEHLLRGVIVVESLSVAVSLAERNRGATLVTVDGDVVRDRAIGGGSETVDAGPIARRRSAAELRRDADERRVQSRARHAEQAAAREAAATAAQRAEKAALRAADARLRQRDVSAALAAARVSQSGLDANIEVLSARRAQAEGALADAQAALHRLENAAAESCSSAAAVEAQRAQAAAAADDLAAAAAAARDHHRLSAANAAALVERVAKAGDDIEAAREGGADLRRRQETSVRALTEAQAVRRTLGDERTALETRRAQADAALAEIAGRTDALRAKRDDLLRAAQSAEEELASQRQQDLAESQASERDRIRLAEIEAELAMLGAAFDQCSASDEERSDVIARYAAYEADIDADIRKAREEQQRLGNVNLNAPEDEDVLLGRREFLRGQLADLERARADVVAVIAQIDEESQRQFDVTFDAVAQAFSQTFERLFGGGQASLTLGEADDPISAGVEIFAQPPGKKMHSLSSLSGGERAMTAVALVFAIIRVRPSPFYIFDEIDAALDEANIGRFGELLTELADRAQTLIVTHNKATMTLADRIYGITMGEPGVSNVLSLAMEQVSA